MVGEDYRSTAFKHVEMINYLTNKVEERKIELEQKSADIIALTAQILEVKS